MTDYSANPIWLQISKHQKLIHLVIVVLLALYLLSYAAQLTWRLFPSTDAPSATAPAAANTQPRQPSADINLSSLKRLNLFGAIGAKPKVVEQKTNDAPETQLNLTLTGVVASSDTQQGAAIIANNGKQNTYGIGEDIDGTNAELKEVYADRVIIENRGRDETLMLDGVEYKKQQQPSSSRPITVSREEFRSVNSQTLRSNFNAEGIRASRELLRSPASFTDYIAISPYSRNGNMQGYRISPGKKPTLFKQAGFKSGDIVTEIDGLDLTDPQQALEAMQALRESQSLQLVIDRQGETLALFLDLPAGEEP